MPSRRPDSLAPTRRHLVAGVLTALVAAFGAVAGAEPPPCGYDDRVAPFAEYDQHARTPLDPLYALGADYAPPDLVPLRRAGFDDARLVRAIVIDDLRALRETAAAAGNPLEIQSAYRSYGYQARVFDSWVAQLGRQRALAVSARPGHSEHQLGTAVDVRSAGGPAPWDLDDWATTPAGAWTAANAWRFGFVMSYPRAARDVTCYAYEPWHYRWVGREAARRIHESGLPLRAWLWREGGPLDAGEGASDAP